MTVGQLIDELEKADKGLPVYVNILEYSEEKGVKTVDIDPAGRVTININLREF